MYSSPSREGRQAQIAAGEVLTTGNIRRRAKEISTQSKEGVGARQFFRDFNDAPSKATRHHGRLELLDRRA